MHVVLNPHVDVGTKAAVCKFYVHFVKAGVFVIHVHTILYVLALLYRLL